MDFEQEAKNHEFVRKNDPLGYIKYALLNKYSSITLNDHSIELGTISKRSFLAGKEEFIIYTLNQNEDLTRKEKKLKKRYIKLLAKDGGHYRYAYLFEKKIKRQDIIYCRVANSEELEIFWDTIEQNAPKD